MNKHAFHNACRILMCIDKYELVEAGIIAADKSGIISWTRFNDEPLKFIAKLSTAKYDALWRLIEDRQPEWYREQS